jgi:hypothetical protein
MEHRRAWPRREGEQAYALADCRGSPVRRMHSMVGGKEPPPQPARPPLQPLRARASDLIPALADYNLSDSEVRTCGAIAIAAYSRGRMQADQMRLAVEYANSVSEEYLATLGKQTTSAESRLTECRCRNRSTPFEVPPAAPR